MATKTISITEEAYERLKMRKNGHESFTDVINKITGKSSIMDFAGLLTEKEAAVLEKNIRKSRTFSLKRAERLRRTILDDS